LSERHTITDIEALVDIRKYHNKFENKWEQDLLCFSYFILISISLHGGYCGRLDGSQAYGSVLKN
jgi:hypothetical protein